uniref:Epoxide hydrolase n=1 Tax=Tabanus bromius TaxID=304241 RepID=A0A0K8TLC3_TABBR
MDFTARVLFVLISLLTAVLIKQYYDLSKPYPVPKMDLDEYWGPGDKAQYKEDKELVVNKLYYDEEIIDDLRQRLNRTLNLHEPLEGVGFEYGVNTDYLAKFVKYWRDDYLARWREREIYLWRFPHFTTHIQGLRMHYLHTKARSDEKRQVFPVLLLHGWPGSVREFYDVIPKLADPEGNSNYVFEVVVPSLPGYGWSQASSKAGLGPTEIAVVMRNLMLRLGYKKFFVQGGDWGALIGSNIAALFPENVIGFHSNMCVLLTPIAVAKGLIAQVYPSYFIEKEFEHLFFPYTDKLLTLVEESGYFHIQATKPDTIGTALTENPVGLAGYLLEKFSTWTNPDYRKLKDGGVEMDFTLDQLLDNIMIYYLTNSITTSQRLYAEAYTKRTRSYKMDRVQVHVPTGCARFKDDLLVSFDWQLKDKYTNLIHSTYHKKGGHFAAFEVPDEFFKDFMQFVDKVIALEK